MVFTVLLFAFFCLFLGHDRIFNVSVVANNVMVGDHNVMTGANNRKEHNQWIFSSTLNDRYIFNTSSIEMDICNENLRRRLQWRPQEV